MPASSDRTAINNARAALDSSRHALIDALLQAEEAGAALDDARRRLAPDNPDLVIVEQTKATADAALGSARTSERSARNNLQTAIGTWLSNVSVDDDFGRLETTSPLVLFPVRLEARFDANLLKLRIYPDEIFLNKHEKALTRDEYAAGVKYYQDLNLLGDEPSRWREIVALFGAERSAYILRILLPTFDTPGGTGTTSTSSFCAGTITGGLNETLTFPTDIQFRASTWTRPGEAVLPDRWVVILIRNGVARTPIVLAPITEPLAITVDPNLPQSQMSQISRNANYAVDNDTRWTVDFQRAVNVGMACQVTLSAAEAAPVTGGFDRVIVLGVKSSMDALATSRMVEDLMDAHHYTRGLAIVRQGSATNNTKDDPTPFPADDQAGARSFEIERRHPPLDRTRAHDCLLPDTDGYALTRMLGVPSGAAANIDRGGEHEIARSFAMGRVIWPATYDYFLRYLMAPVVAPADVDRARGYFSQYVSARGPAPAFRVGAVPYGVLPITSLGRWQARTLGTADEQAIESGILGPLKHLVSLWNDKVGQVPHITPGSSTPDVDLVQVLTTLPSANEVRLRFAQEEVVYYDLFNYLGWYFGTEQDSLNRLSQDLFGQLAHPEWRPRLGRLIFQDKTYTFTAPLVAPKLSEDAPLAQDFVNGIWSATLAQTLSFQIPIQPAAFNLCYFVMLRAALLEYARVAATITPTTVWTEPLFWFFPSIPSQLTIGQLLQQTGEPARNQATEFRDALLRLVNIPSAELDRLFSEALDLSSRRIDAWVTAFANRRVQKMRDAQRSAQLAPVGDFLGGYGWLENLRPRVRQTTTVDGITAEVQAGTGGYIHAPSMTHASAAAVLRSASLTANLEAAGKYTVDLSSRRMRDAKLVLDEVRNRQPLGAVLGYRFERALHEGHPTVAGLDQARFALRALYPLVAGKNGVDTAEPAETVAARNLVDGLKMLRASRKGLIPFNQNPKLPIVGSPGHVVILQELANLEALFDAVSDLLTAEGVYQLVLGNVVGAPPSLENLIAGRSPPDPVVARSPRGGTAISHRVAFVFPDNALPAPSPHWIKTTPRAQAEPILDGWLGELLGDPDNVTCRVTFNEAPGSIRVKLTDLQIAPLDILAIARAVADRSAGSSLDERILTAALGADTTKTGVAIDYTRPAGSTDLTLNRTFPEILEVARSLASVLDKSRALAPADLLPPAERDAGLDEAEASALVSANELASRAATAAAAFGQITGGTDASAGPSLALALDGVDPQNATDTAAAAIRTALRQAAYFVPARAFPSRTASNGDLAATGLAVLAELQARQKAIPTDSGGDSVAVTARAAATLKAIFGAGFVALPHLDPTRGDELAQALAARSDLLGGDEGAPDRYLAQAARVEGPLGRWRKLSLYARAMGAPKPRLDIVQLPFVPGEKWLGLDLGVDGVPDESRSALLLLSDTDALDPSLTWRGLMIDQWTEVIPRKEEQTGIAFHYDAPRAAAPQAVLVVAPASNTASWQFADLLAAVQETMDLAKIRAVDAQMLSVGQLVPLSLLASNPFDQVTVPADVGTNIGTAVAAAAQGFI